MNHSFDVAVVGLGPVGATCAALLGTLGLKTVAIERSAAIYDKPVPLVRTRRRSSRR